MRQEAVHGDQSNSASTGRLMVMAMSHAVRMMGWLLGLLLSIPCIGLGHAGLLLNRYADVSILVSKIPFYVGEHARYLYYKATIRAMGRNVTIKFGSFCQYANTYIGNNVVIGFYNTLGEVRIGDDVLTGGYVNILSGTAQHAFSDPTRKINRQPAAGRRLITIGSDVWIGSNCVIANDVGNRCVIGTGSVLIDRAEDHGVYAGNPARLVKKID